MISLNIIIIINKDRILIEREGKKRDSDLDNNWLSEFFFSTKIKSNYTHTTY